jgi:mannose-6-phosphate isomerase-like protein (cupin superfamily)
VKLPTDGAPPAQPHYFPGVGGFRFGFFTLGPHGARVAEGIDINAAIAELSEKLPGLAEHMEQDNPGMHTTDTIDYGVVVSGEVVLELDDGAETTLHAGDAYIQNGTRHRWHNRTDQPAVIAIAIVGAQR